MRLSRPRRARRSWPRLPRRTARLRLTVVYGGLFLVSGAVLLAITYVLFERAVAGHVTRIIGKATAGGITHQFLTPSETGQRAAQRASDLHQLLVNSGIALAIVAGLALFLGWIVGGRVLRPVRTITAATRRISATNLHERLALHHADEEFKQLGDTLNELLARLDAAFEAQRHFVANASHELRTPLTRERTLLQVALDDPSTSDAWRSTGQELLSSNREQERLIEALLALASSEAGLDQTEPIDLANVCETVLLRPELDANAVGLHIETVIRPAPLDGDSKLIERLVANLVDNAVRYNQRDGRVHISTTTIDGRAVLTIANTGPVIPPSEVDRLFQPFQRLNSRRAHHKAGHGLGLSIVQAIATAHSATITARAQPTGGLSVGITFPPPTSDDHVVHGESAAHGSPLRSSPGADGAVRDSAPSGSLGRGHR